MTRLAIGAYNQFPYYEVIGDPTSFYIWIQLQPQSWAYYEPGKQGASGWIRGQEAFKAYNKLKELLEKGQKEKFIGMMTDLHCNNKGTP